jgi:hypothetical protein
VSGNEVNLEALAALNAQLEGVPEDQLVQVNVRAGVLRGLVGDPTLIEPEQVVYLSVTQGEHSLVLQRSRENHWPGTELPHITELIREVADAAIREIRLAEAGADWDKGTAE